MPIYIAPSRQSSIERVTKLGSAAAGWQVIFDEQVEGPDIDDSNVWLAMVVMEVFSLLKSQFQIFPIKILKAKETDGSNLVRLVSRSEDERDALSQSLKLPLPAKTLQRMLENDDGGSDWVLTSTDVLGRTSSQDTGLIFQSIDVRETGLEVYISVQANKNKIRSLPSNASKSLMKVVRDVANRKKPKIPSIATKVNNASEQKLEISFDPSDVILGGEAHLECFEELAANAKKHVFLLSTFIADAVSAKDKDRFERVCSALERACARGVHCFFYGPMNVPPRVFVCASISYLATINAIT